MARSTVLLVAAAGLVTVCASPDTTPETLRVSKQIALLDVLDRARWQPEVVNLNNPTIDSRDADLGDGRVRVLLCHPVATLTWRLHLAVPVRLVTGIALLPDAWSRSGDGAGFRVSVDDGRRHTLFHARVDPGHRAEDRRWTAVDIDLSAWHGRTVLLTLSTDPGPGTDPTWDWAIWRDPMLVVDMAR